MAATCLACRCETKVHCLMSDRVDELDVKVQIMFLEICDLLPSIDDFLCTLCYHSLYKAYSFKKQYLTAQREFQMGRQPLETWTSSIQRKLQVYIDDGLPASIRASCESKVHQFNELKTKCDSLVNKFKERLFSEVLDYPLRPFQCELCGRTFKVIATLKKHMTTHRDRVPVEMFACSECPKEYTREENLAVHRRKHTGLRPFVCEECGRAFVQRDDLRRHLKVHSDKRDFACPCCSRTFKHSHNMLSHMRTHTGARPYSCPHCAKTYTSHSGFKNHSNACKDQVL